MKCWVWQSSLTRDFQATIDLYCTEDRMREAQVFCYIWGWGVFGLVYSRDRHLPKDEECYKDRVFKCSFCALMLPYIKKAIKNTQALTMNIQFETAKRRWAVISPDLLNIGLFPTGSLVALTNFSKVLFNPHHVIHPILLSCNPRISVFSVSISLSSLTPKPSTFGEHRQQAWKKGCYSPCEFKHLLNWI